MIAYWLGRLSDEEQARLEQECFADDEKYAQFQTVQNDLIDAYVRDRLAPADRVSFERHYLASPWQRARVDFARALAERADQAPVKSIEPAPAWWQRLKELRWPGLPVWPAWPAWGLAGLAAVLLLAAASAWLLLNVSRLRQELRLAQGQLNSEREQAGQARTRLAEFDKELERERAQRAQLEKELLARQHNPTPSPATAASIISFILTPPLFRDGGSLPRLQLKPGVQLVRLQLKFSSPELFRNFSVEVETPDEKQIWRSANLPAQPTKGGRQVTVALPAASLPSGDYVVKLKGRPAQGELVEVANYPLRVTQN